MNAIALCHNRDLQKTNGRIIVLGSGSISLMQTATWVNMQPYWQSGRFFLHFDNEIVCSSVCISVCSMWLSPSLCDRFVHSSSTLPSCHTQINLYSRPTWSPRWLNRFSVFFISDSRSQTSSVFLYSTCLPETEALLCSLLTVKSWENCPENPEQKGV